ncbi:uncharacterized protein [Manis javanica]|uniref:uncharacterized protein n=1 Tax=Manis javanica TaxID=9974 RepID=UPI003C6D8A8D
MRTSRYPQGQITANYALHEVEVVQGTSETVETGTEGRAGSGHRAEGLSGGRSQRRRPAEGGRGGGGPECGKPLLGPGASPPWTVLGRKGALPAPDHSANAGRYFSTAGRSQLAADERASPEGKREPDRRRWRSQTWRSREPGRFAGVYVDRRWVRGARQRGGAAGGGAWNFVCKFPVLRKAAPPSARMRSLLRPRAVGALRPREGEQEAGRGGADGGHGRCGRRRLEAGLFTLRRGRAALPLCRSEHWLELFIEAVARKNL